MEEITSLIIRRLTATTWSFEDNTMPVGKSKGNDAYGGHWDEFDTYTFKSKTGGIIYNRIPIDAISYIDDTDPDNNFNPTDPVQLHVYLEEVDFFEDSNSGGGSTDIALTDLTDAGFTNKFGREGQVLIISEDGITFNTRAVNFVENIQDLNNVPEIVPNSILGSNTNGTGTIWIDRNNITAPFLPFGQQRIKFKGYRWISEDGEMIVNPLTQNIAQPGDILEGWVTDGDPEDNTSSWYVMLAGRYKFSSGTGGGDKRVLSSYENAQLLFMAFTDDPDYNKPLNLT